MNYDGGQCVGCNDALEWVQELKDVDTEMRDKVWRRMAYEFDKGIPTKPKFHKGQYGHKYDNYTCGHCGVIVHLPIDKFCYNCGSKIMQPDPNGKTADDGFHHYEAVSREKYEQLVFDFEEASNGK